MDREESIRMEDSASGRKITDPDSDVEESSSPIITNVNVPNSSGAGDTTVHRDEEAMVISDDGDDDDITTLKEGSEENPITLSDDESDKTVDEDETQRISDGEDTQRTSSSEDSRPVPIDLKPSRSPQSILSSVPNISISRQNSEFDESPGSPSLIDSRAVPEVSTSNQSSGSDRSISPSILHEPASMPSWKHCDGSLPDEDLLKSMVEIEKTHSELSGKVTDVTSRPTLHQPKPQNPETNENVRSPSQLEEKKPSWTPREGSLTDDDLLPLVEQIERRHNEEHSQLPTNVKEAKNKLVGNLVSHSRVKGSSSPVSAHLYAKGEPANLSAVNVPSSLAEKVTSETVWSEWDASAGTSENTNMSNSGALEGSFTYLLVQLSFSTGVLMQSTWCKGYNFTDIPHVPRLLPPNCHLKTESESLII